jgi:hypothetical protein
MASPEAVLSAVFGGAFRSVGVGGALIIESNSRSNVRSSLGAVSPGSCEVNVRRPGIQIRVLLANPHGSESLRDSRHRGAQALD